MIIALLVHMMHCEGLASAPAEHKPFRTVWSELQANYYAVCFLCTSNIVNH